MEKFQVLKGSVGCLPLFDFCLGLEGGLGVLILAFGGWLRDGWSPMNGPVVLHI